MLKLYYWPGYCSLGDQIALEWIGAYYELVKAGEELRQSDAYAKLNPSRTVPVLVTDDGWATGLKPSMSASGT